MSMSIETALKEAMSIEGAAGASLTDYDSGMPLGMLVLGDEIDLDVASAVTTDIIRAQVRAMQTLGIEEAIEDILITLENQYHIIRLVNRNGSRLFLYVALERDRSNLALARHTLRKIERELDV